MTRCARALVVVAMFCSVGLTACANDDTSSRADRTLRIATVDNGDMIRMQELAKNFTSAHPGVELDWVTLGEGELRQRVTTDIATDGGQFDVVTLGTYETPIWAERKWLTPLDDLSADYATDDILPPIREALSFEEKLYAAPFYGESAFTMYRKDLLAAAGLRMPAEPTWAFIKKAAAAIERESDAAGICLRGKPGWGENMAFVTAAANSYGARWFDNDWRPQLDSDAWSKAVTDYVELGEHAPPGVTEAGYNENLESFRDGKCGIWVDATAAASFVTDRERSRVAGDVGFALAPSAGSDRRSNWLWAWALAIPKSSEHKDLAKEFVTWATSPGYTELVAGEYGWLHAPPGTRKSLYENREYLAAAPFAELALESIKTADPQHPTAEEVPYSGIQYVTIPEFQSIGTAVGNQIAAALAGEIPVDEALRNSQWVTGKVIGRTRLID